MNTSTYNPDATDHVIRFISGLTRNEWNYLRTQIPTLPEITARSVKEFQLPTWIKNNSEPHFQPHPDSFVVATNVKLENSYLWNNVDKDIIDDVLAFTSVAKCSLVNVGFRISRVEGSHSFGHTVVQSETDVGLFDPWLGTGAVVVKKLRIAAKCKNVQLVPYESWLKAFRWHYHAMLGHVVAPGILTMANRWISLEVLGNSFIDNNPQYSSIKGIRKKVMKMLEVRGWDTSSGSWLNERLKYWYESRNFTVHAGNAHPDFSVLTARFHELNRFVSGVLIELADAVTDKSDLIARVISGDDEPPVH